MKRCKDCKHVDRVSNPYFSKDEYCKLERGRQWYELLCIKIRGDDPEAERCGYERKAWKIWR